MSKNILFLDQYGFLGGGQQVLLELVASAINTGNKATILLPDGPCADKLRELGAQVHPIGACTLTQGKKSIADIFRFLSWNFSVFLKNWKILLACDLVYVNGLRLLPVAMLAQRILGKNSVAHVHLNHGARELGVIRKGSCLAERGISQ